MNTTRGTYLTILFFALLPAAGPPAASAVTRELNFDDRLACRRAVEEVYWRHRIWPASNPGPKPPLAAVLPAERLAARVEDGPWMSDALAFLWQRPLTAVELQAEIDRMARATRRPEMLRELWQALGNDPLWVAECLARPALADRLARARYAFDERFHGPLRAAAEAELKGYGGVGEMRSTSGRYELQVWRRAAEGEEAAPPGAGGGTEERILDAGEWRAAVADLGGRLGVAAGSSSAAELPVAKISRLQEDEDRFFALAVVEAAADRLVVAGVEWRKVPFDEWWQEVRSTFPPAVPAAAAASLRLPAIKNAGCTPDAWTPVRAYPRARAGHVAVWTGSEMLIWGGRDFFSDGVPGGWYDPSIDAWYPIRMEGQPLGRADATAVWTGSEMVVWGGWQGADVSNVVNTGGRYNPATDTWAPTSTGGGVPSGRTEHRAVWTGSEMIVWGGCASALGCGAGYFDDGGRYDPATDTWTPTSTAGAPAGRSLHSAVWTGSEMVVWGGQGAGVTVFDDGGRYDPAADAWTAMTTADAPQARVRHTAVWTGSEMIVFAVQASAAGS